jgi:recombination protein RecA
MAEPARDLAAQPAMVPDQVALADSPAALSDNPALATVLEHPALVRLRTPEAAPAPGPAWSLAELTGRLSELVPGPEPAVLSAAFALVRQAQRLGEPVAWVAVGADLFYPPDVAAGGVDLAAMPVVRTADSLAAGRAADLALRSGAFGLVVLDLGRQAALPTPVQSRLVQLAIKHEAAVVCLADRPLGSLVSLRVAATRRRLGPGRFACEVTAIKDKRRGPGWRWQEVWGAPPGLH